MLVLTRKSEEKIIIDDGCGNIVEVTVLKIQGDKVSIGIVAPPETQIWRKELLDKQSNSAPNSIQQTVHDLQINVGNKISEKATSGIPAA